MKPRTLAAAMWLALALIAWLSFNGFAWAGSKGTGFGSGVAEGLEALADEIACNNQFTDPIVRQQCILQKQQLRAQQKMLNEQWFWQQQRPFITCIPVGMTLQCF